MPRLLLPLLRSLLLLLALSGPGGPVLAQAVDGGDGPGYSPYPITLAYCIDRASSTDPGQLLGCEFHAHNALPRQAPADGARWVRLIVSLDRSQPRGLRVYIGPHSLPRVTFFEPVPGGWSAQTAGSALPSDPRHAVAAGYRFTTGTQAAGPATFYLRVQAPGLMHLRVLAEPLDAPERGLQGQLLWLGLQLGALAIMAVIALASTLLHRDRLMQRFAWYAANLALCVLSGSGLLSLAFLGDFPRLDAWLFQWLLCLRLSLWIWLMSAFFEGWSLPRWYRHLCLALHGLVGLCLVLVPLGGQVALQALVLAGTAVFSVAQIVVLLHLRGMPRFYRQVLLAGFLATDALIAGAVLATVYPGGSDLATVLVRGVDFATPLVLLLIIAFKRRLDQQEFVRVKGALREESLRAEFHQQAVQDRKMLIDMLTHELRNPLASISFAVGSLQDRFDSPSERQAKRLDNIHRSIRNMDSVIERCSLMNLMDQEGTAVRKQALDLVAFVHAQVGELSGHDRFEVHAPAKGCPLASDPQLLKIVIGNLLENALKYAPLGDRIQVRVERVLRIGGAEAVVSVANTVGEHGAPDPEHAFRKFYRHPLAQAQSGSGLGLYLVREICRWLEGDVRYRLGEGPLVVFEVRLPL